MPRRARLPGADEVQAAGFEECLHELRVIPGGAWRALQHVTGSSFLRRNLHHSSEYMVTAWSSKCTSILHVPAPKLLIMTGHVLHYLLGKRHVRECRRLLWAMRHCLRLCLRCVLLISLSLPLLLPGILCCRH